MGRFTRLAIFAVAVLVLVVVLMREDASDPAPTPPADTSPAPAAPPAPEAPRVAAVAPIPEAPARRPDEQDVTGFIRSESGEPIPGALVRALRQRGYRGYTEEVLHTAAAKTGEYVLGPLEGYVLVEVSAPDFGTTRRHGQPGMLLDFALPAAGSIVGRVIRAEDGGPASGALVEAVQHAEGRHFSRAPPPLSARAETDGGFRFEGLTPGHYRVRARPADGPVAAVPGTVIVKAGAETSVHIVVPPGVALTGRVLDEGGEPIPGATVCFDRTPEPRAVTDAEGRYRLHGLRASPGLRPSSAPGALIARADGFATTTQYSSPDSAGTGPCTDIVMKAEGVMSGQVVDTEGRPVAGAEVRVYLGGAQEWTLSAADGSFRLGGLDYGNHQVFVGKDGLVGIRAARVAVQHGEETTGVVFTLHLGGEISGRVIDDAGNAVSGAMVYYENQGGITTPGGDDLYQPLPQVTARDGTYRFRPVRYGPFRISAVAPGMLPSVTGVLSLELRERCEGVDLVLSPGAVVAGRVVDEEGRPVAGARVDVYIHAAETDLSISRAGNHGWGITDAEGRFRLDGLPSGPCTVNVRKEHLHTSAGQLHTGRDDVSLVLESLPLLSGRVGFADTGRPATGFWLIVTGERGASEQFLSDAEGRFSVPQRPGEYGVAACAPGGLVSPEIRARVPGEPVELSLAPGGSLGGTVTGIDGLPAERATISVRRPGESTVLRSSRTATDGTFAAGFLPSGSYEVHVRKSESERRRTVVVVAGEETRVALDLSGPGVLRVIVTDPEGDPVKDAVIDLLDPAGNPVTLDSPDHRRRFGYHQRGRPELTWEEYERTLRHTGARGRFAFRELPPGRYSISVTADSFATTTTDVVLTADQAGEARLTLSR